MAPKLRLAPMDDDEAADAEAAFEAEAESEFPDADASPSRRRSQSPFEKSLGVRILAKTFYGSFKLAGLALGSTAEWDPREFEEPANDLKELVNRFKVLRIVFNVLHPVVSCVSLIDKAKKLRNGMPVRQKKEEPRTASGEQQIGSMFGQ